jgi:ABC-type phosphate transport system substrate-binding protein
VKKPLLILPLALLITALGLSACGGGSSSSSSSSGGGDEAEIEKAIETAATSTDPSKCTEAQTEYFNETESGKTGEAALTACEEEVEAGEEQAESVTVSQIEIQGEEEGEAEGAAAIAEVEGGGLNGQAIGIALEKEEGVWKVDGFMGFAHYDGAAMAENLEAKFAEEEGISPEVAACMAEGVEEMNAEEASSLIFEKDNEGLEEILTACQE